MIFGRENHFGIRVAIAGNCSDFSLFALSTAAWQFARKKKMIFGSRKIIFVKLDGDLLGLLAFALSTAARQTGAKK